MSNMLLTGQSSLIDPSLSSDVIFRDISRLNVMMDSTPILPDMFHPQQPWSKRHVMKDIRPYTRTARPVKYYFTDFGLSRRYSPDEKNPLEVPILGGDRTVPEFQNDHYTPRNPFHTDVYYMGNLIRTEFMEVGIRDICVLQHADVNCATDVYELRVHGASYRADGPGRARQASDHGRSCLRVSRDCRQVIRL